MSDWVWQLNATAPMPSGLKRLSATMKGMHDLPRDQYTCR